ncbi:MAG: RpiB/LacA/LacB family sugar-phosphate isomerase [Candidatus Komeilibacteria bacterium]|nr:RpiB/LacA/LacB family sugar-phosphate isomerase [Candidatus Komeilibacteria bacterium]
MIYLGADHNGFKTKEYLKKYFDNKNIDYIDLGNTKFQKTDDYPDFAKAVAKKVQKSKKATGILLCGSGQGMCIVANKFKNIRAILGWSSAAARRARHDDDANILCLPAWRLTNEKTLQVVRAWLATDFGNLTRYKRRIKKINI